MSDCTSKLKFTCGGPKLFASCVYYEGTLPEWSSLTEESCVVVEEALDELYTEVNTLKTETDVSTVESDCLTIIEDGEGKVTVKTLLESLVTEVEALKCPEEVTNDLDLTDLELDYKCLEDECNNPIDNKLSTILQALINAYCAEEDTPQLITNTGVIDIIHKATHITTTTASAFTLGSGREGQYKFIKLVVDGGTATVAIPGLEGGTQAVFADAGDFLYVLYSGAKWNIITNSGVTIS